MEDVAGEGVMPTCVSDPPRAGCDKRILSSLARLKPERVVYVSCNPDTWRATRRR